MKPKELLNTFLSSRQKEFLIKIKKKVTGKTFSAVIEISGYCNARCPYCPTSSSKSTSKEFIAPALLEEIIIHLKREKLLPDGATIQLYNYGEPFIHPQINEILEVLEKNNCRAGFSSNFIKLPKIENKHYNVIDFIVFSLCGLTEETYRRIYGANIEKILNNFDLFLENKKLHNDNIRMVINWLVYKFSEHQIDDAKTYFTERNSDFRPIKAYINKVETMMKLYENKLTDDEEQNLRNDINVDEILSMMKFLKHKYPDFKCPQEQQLVINESGILLNCCETQHKSFELGNILSLNRSDMLTRKNELMRSDICRKCINYGISQLAHLGYLHL